MARVPLNNPRPAALGRRMLKQRRTIMTAVREVSGQSGNTPVERMYFAWNDALSRNDAAALLSLYARDAHFESRLVPHLLDRESGVLRGHAELRPLFAQLAARKPPVRQYYRTGYLTDGKRLIWEYPRDAGKGEQMDFTEVMELNEEGLIQRHCVYWGWFGVRVLQRNEYHR
jgi:SnoaL-like domain